MFKRVSKRQCRNHICTCKKDIGDKEEGTGKGEGLAGMVLQTNIMWRNAFPVNEADQPDLQNPHSEMPLQ